MPDSTSPENKDAKPVKKTSNSDSRANSRELDPILHSSSKDETVTNHEAAHHKNDRPYGFSSVWIGLLINGVLVVVLICQTWAVYGQLRLSHEALERGNESFRQTIIEMRDQGDALTAQVESMATLTSTFAQIFRDQQRARLSFRVELEEVDDVQTGIRVVCPIETGGITEARQVRFRNYVSASAPGQRWYLESITLDWSQRESHELNDVAPTEVGRRFVSSDVLSQERLKIVVSRQESLYFVGRLEYCDVYGACRYFMRCAELGHQTGVITYCGTRMGDLDADSSD